VVILFFAWGFATVLIDTPGIRRDERMGFG
jgi:hypothetical protein